MITKKIFKFGITSEFLYKEIIIRTGKSLDNEIIDWNKKYSHVGVKTTNWEGFKPCYLDYDNKNIFDYVDMIKGLLEEKLNENFELGLLESVGDGFENMPH